MWKLTVGSALAVGLFAASAQAGVITGTPVSTPIPGWTGFLLSAQSSSTINAIDLATGANGISGTMHQRWTVDEELNQTATPSRETYSGASLTNSFRFDSHFLLDGDAGNGLITPTEGTAITAIFSTPLEGPSPLGANPPGGPADTETINYGIATALEAAFGILPTYADNDVTFAYIVIPNTGSVTVTALLSNAIGQGDPAVGVIQVPEPSTLGLAMAAAAALLRRRRTD